MGVSLTPSVFYRRWNLPPPSFPVCLSTISAFLATGRIQFPGPSLNSVFASLASQENRLTHLIIE